MKDPHGKKNPNGRTGLDGRYAGAEGNQSNGHSTSTVNSSTPSKDVFARYLEETEKSCKLAKFK